MTPQPSNSPRIPPLREGQRLTREEFERRYDAMPELKKAELLEGVVHMGSPVRLTEHGAQDYSFTTWLGYFKAFTPGTFGGSNCTVRLETDSEPQPDSALIVLPDYGGQTRINDGYIDGGPELVCEIAASTKALDLGKKLQLYQRNGVKEYIVWRVLDEAIDWFVLRDGEYERLKLSDEGWYRSETFPGLWLDPAAMIKLDLATVLGVVQKGVASAEHLAFVQLLEDIAKKKENNR